MMEMALMETSAKTGARARARAERAANNFRKSPSKNQREFLDLWRRLEPAKKKLLENELDRLAAGKGISARAKKLIGKA